MRFKIDHINMPEEFEKHQFLVKFKDGERSPVEMFRFDMLEGHWKVSRISNSFKKLDQHLDLTMPIGESDHSTENRKKECKMIVIDERSGSTFAIGIFDVAQFGSHDNPKTIEISLNEKLSGGSIVVSHFEQKLKGVGMLPPRK